MIGIKKILVTGAGGFIGSALCSRILAEGGQVCGTGRSESHTTRFPEGVENIQTKSIGPKTNWSESLKEIDTVVHLAARVHVIDDTVANPLEAFRKVNVAGTKKLAQSAVSAGVRRIIFLSSIKVNGEGRASAYTEEDKEAPEDPYGLSKWEAEKELHKISHTTGIEVVILRPPLVYGPGVKANFYNLLKIVDRGIPLPFAKIDNLRSFIYLDNLIDVIITCINHPRAEGRTFLVNDREDVSTPELIRKIASALGKPTRLFSIPHFLMRLAGKFIGKSAAIDRLFGSLTIDSTRIREELEWKPPYTMEYGLKETARWYAKKLVS